MEVVPGLTSAFYKRVVTIVTSADRENLPVLNPGFDNESSTWFNFLAELSGPTARILKNNWHHEWPTYRLIPEHFKEQWFLLLAVSIKFFVLKTPHYSFVITLTPLFFFLLARIHMGKKHILKVWTQFNLVARTIFREEMRELRKRFERGDRKPEWMTTRVWELLVDMFEEFGPADAGY